MMQICKMERFRLRGAGWLVLTIVFLSPSHANSQEPISAIDIKLGPDSRNDSRLELIQPPQGSTDSMELSTAGILIKQSNTSSSQSKAVGFKLLAGSQTHFSFLLDFECLHLEQPKSGWGQGLLIRIVTEDPKAPVMAIGYVATKKMKNVFVSTMNHTNSQNQEFDLLPLTHTKGRWLVERQGNELIVARDESGFSFRQINRMQCTTAPVRELQVLCTRQDSGNMPAEFLLKSIRFAGDQFFDQPRPAPPVFTLDRLLRGGIFIVGIASTVFLVRYLFAKGYLVFRLR